eukprot:9467030-Ditylum_brightwellii.AAC.1
MIGIIWYHFIKLSEKIGTINSGQVGKRAGHNASTIMFIKDMKDKLSHCISKTLAYFDDSAASCYYQIIPNQGSLLGRKKGLYRNITFIHANALTEA